MMKRALFVIFLVIFSVSFAQAGPSQGQAQTPILTDSAVSSSFAVNQVSMTSTAALIKAAPTSSHYRYSITIKNSGSKTVYLGPAATVTSSTGFPLGSGEAITLDRTYSAVYGICASGETSTVAYLEEAR